MTMTQEAIRMTITSEDESTTKINVGSDTRRIETTTVSRKGGRRTGRRQQKWLLLAVAVSSILLDGGGGISSSSSRKCDAFQTLPLSWRSSCRQAYDRHYVLSNEFLENDLVAVRVRTTTKTKKIKYDDYDDDTEGTELATDVSRLCVVRPDQSVAPLCVHEGDVETDLWIDPRELQANDKDRVNFWTREVTDDDVVGRYGEGWYGQRPVPSLGGGPGYGAEADEIWSIDDDVLEQIRKDHVDLPTLDVGIAHGEKARGGSLF